jgi:hypothetical protein
MDRRYWSFTKICSWSFKASGNTTGTECDSDTFVHETATPDAAYVAGGTAWRSLDRSWTSFSTMVSVLPSTLQ